MSTGDPSQQIFWLASRALGIVAIALLAVSVALGLAMSGRLARRPGLPAKLKRVHEAATLVTLGLIVVHAGALLADPYLRPGLAGVTLPFQLAYRPLWTATGILAGWLTVILGLSFYARRWIGVKTWRWLHRWTLAIYLLAVAHAIGAGTDGRSTWMIAMLTLLTTPIVFAFTYRTLPAQPRKHRTNQPVDTGAPITAPLTTRGPTIGAPRAHSPLASNGAQTKEGAGGRVSTDGELTTRASTAGEARSLDFHPATQPSRHLWPRGTHGVCRFPPGGQRMDAASPSRTGEVQCRCGSGGSGTGEFTSPLVCV